MSKDSPLHSRPLAHWKTWWDKDLAVAIASSLNQHIQPRNLPGYGCLLGAIHFNGDSLKNVHVASITEALLVSYPSDRQPSGYLLGYAVLELDKIWNGSLLGGASDSPIKERARRDSALAQGGRLKALLSYIRTSALKAENGKSEQVTYLKTLANQRQVRFKRSSSVSTAASTSPCSCCSEPTVVLG